MRLPRERKRDLLVALALAVAAFAVFSPVGQNAFIDFDDFEYITENPHVRTGLTAGNVLWAFTSYHSHNWHPLTWISHMVDVELFGLEARGHHLMNAALHGLNAGLLFLFLAAATGAPGRSAFVAALFALHPLHVESVAWAAERKDTLSTLFWLLTMTAYLKWVRKRTMTAYALVTVLYACGLMAKQMLVTLPLVLLILDYWPLGRWVKRGTTAAPRKRPGKGKQGAARVTAAGLVTEKIPLFALAAAASVVVYLVQWRTGVLHAAPFPLPWRIANALVSYCAYLGKAFWPADLAVFYPHPLGTLPAWKPLAAAVFLGAVTAAAWSLRHRAPYLLAGWLWYLVTLLPVIGLVQVGVQALADRYTYMPLTGVFIALSWGARDLAGRPAVRKEALAAAMAAVLIPLAVVTVKQISYWRDNVTLYRRAAEVVPNNYWAYNNLGAALASRGRLEEAIPLFERSLMIMPYYPGANMNMAAALYRLRRYGEALPYAERALAIQPQNPRAHVIRGAVLLKVGRVKEAREAFLAALKIAPGDRDALEGLEEASRGPT